MSVWLRMMAEDFTPLAEMAAVVARSRSADGSHGLFEDREDPP